MERREFLRLVSVTAMTSPIALDAHQTGDAPPAATVLYDDKAVALRTTGRDPNQMMDALWVRTRDLPDINQFEVKPQGACRADICIPIPKEMRRGEYFNLSAFAKKIGQPVVAEPETRVWSFGEIQAVRGTFLEHRMAPDFAVPDRAGRPVHLSRFRGKKVLVMTWASW